MAGKFIKGAIKHPGALHAELGVPTGQKIPRARLIAIRNKLHKKAQTGKLTVAQSTLLKRVNLALTLRKF